MTKPLAFVPALLVAVLIHPVPAAASPPAHIVVILMENHEYGEIIGNPKAPYINSLASTYALATNYHAVTHPSLPNYLTLTGGSTFGIRSDCERCHVAGDYLGADMTTASVPWMAYIENVYPDSSAPCKFFNGGSQYDKAHNPWSYYDQLRQDSSQCVLVQPYEDAFDPANMPQFSWITPNLIHDMHNGTISQGDSWLAANVPPILNAMSGSDVLFLTWDEGTTNQGGGGRVVTIASGPGANTGFQDATAYDHYSLLRTMEDLLGLPCLRNACSAQPMTAMLKP